MKRLLLFLLAAPMVLFADGLADVRATLQKLQSEQPLRARVEIKTRRLGGESDKQKQSQAISAVIVESGPQGLSLSWSPEQVKQSRKAAWAETANPDAPKSDLATLKALGGGEALNLLDAPIRCAADWRKRFYSKTSATLTRKNQCDCWSSRSTWDWTKKSARR